MAWRHNYEKNTNEDTLTDTHFRHFPPGGGMPHIPFKGLPINRAGDKTRHGSDFRDRHSPAETDLHELEANQI